MTVLPGVGMLAEGGGVTVIGSNNGTAHNVIDYGRGGGEWKNRPNVWAAIPETDEANLPRDIHPAAGSFALQHNLTYVVTHPDGIRGGGEIFVDRGGWHRDRALLRGNDDSDSSSGGGGGTPESGSVRYRDTRKLFEKGSCLDNLHPGLSSHDGYGRGAFASRFLPEGSIVAPVPVLPLPRSELRYLRSKEWKKVKTFQRKLVNEGSGGGLDRKETGNALLFPPGMKWRDQLLLNYCFGHGNSSVLLFPYGMHVNLINHAPSSAPYPGASSSDHRSGGKADMPVANVAIRWSEKLTEKDNDPRMMIPSELFSRPNPEGLVFEYIALRDIRPDEEIFLDYGTSWFNAWEIHGRHWNEEHNSLNNDKTKK